MKSTVMSRRDLDFLLYEWLRVDELTKRERFADHSRETFDGVLDLCEQLAVRYFAPHNKKSDANEPTFDGTRVTVFDASFRFRADALTAIMLLTVTFISSFIAIYSIGYMHGDPGYPRFFACVSLFLAAMTLLVSADNFLVLYAGWEGVGLCSYLLIGFWFTKPSAAAAARKAFLVTRLGDIGLFVGIALLWSYTDGALEP